ncbi:MAG: MFS transporter [Fusobacteriaceae bacterium]
MFKLSALYFLFYFCLGGSLLYFSSFFNSIGISGKMSGLIFSMGSMLAMIWQPLLGYISDRSKKTKEILIALMGTMALALLILGLKPLPAVAFIGFLIYSLTIWGFMPLIDSVTVNTGYSFGRIRLWGSIGFSVGSFVSGKVIEMTEQNGFLFLISGVAVITALALLTLENNSAKEGERAHFSDILNLIKNKNYLIFIIFTILILGTMNSHNTFFSLYFNKIGGGAGFFGTVVFLITMSEVPFMGLASRWVERFGTKKILLISGGLLALRWGIYYFIPSPKIVALSFFLQGASIGVFFAVAATHIKKIVDPKTISTAMTTYMAAGTLGGTMTQLVSGNIIDSLGVVSIYLFFMVFSLIGVGVFSFEKNK